MVDIYILLDGSDTKVHDICTQNHFNGGDGNGEEIQ